ncbi:MAG TPA: penicillin-binding transpeptidase domain-containing protein, partial [Candidatus Sulfotelmatobacter sp.]|nr:penicillin-binding transpeptidase domain-containing protein [Candidatus Sulfotelmatobacter sp.]
GVRDEPYAIRKVTDSQGRTLEEHLSEPQSVMRPETAFVLTHLMQGVIERGTATRAKVLQRPLAGKTGTSSEATDVWFVGFSPSLVAGVWLGYDVKRSLGSAETGSRLALPIWIAFMQKALEGPPEEFPVPENVVAISVDHTTGSRAAPGDRNAILEYFIKGTEPRIGATAPTPQPALGPDAPGEPTPAPPIAVPLSSPTAPAAPAPGPAADLPQRAANPPVESAPARPSSSWLRPVPPAPNLGPDR